MNTDNGGGGGDTTTTTEFALFYLLITLTALFLANRFFSRCGGGGGGGGGQAAAEGFEQSAVFVLKRNAQVFDRFYGEIHDVLHKPELSTPQIVDAVIRMTQMNREDAATGLLDLCCGTAYVTNAFAKRGFVIYGVDLSPSMVALAAERYPRLRPFLQVGDVELPMTFEKNVFSHVLCLNKSIYLFQDDKKKSVIMNAFHWLQPNGYFVLHLVDPSTFDSIVPAGRVNVMYLAEAEGDQDEGAKNPKQQQQQQQRIRSTEIDFLDFEYRASWSAAAAPSPPPPGGACAGVVEVFTEKFQDSRNGKVRQNEVTYHLHSIDGLTDLCRQCGFILRGKTAIMKQPREYLLVLERPNFF